MIVTGPRHFFMRRYVTDCFLSIMNAYYDLG